MSNIYEAPTGVSQDGVVTDAICGMNCNWGFGIGIAIVALPVPGPT